MPLDAGVFPVLSHGAHFGPVSTLALTLRWRVRDAGVRRTLASEEEPEWAPRRWRFYCAGV